ncbi:uncharacterized protein LOC18442121 isoform X2 [Amborella trichopoda]|uniref:uncharacterized protein LOC18442121 isoform X2 n=1 Tax=Amborella trichopoda TaxID=13333 RepID=UPI0009C0A286|nr:uncharacterized protein LOC18442121 isoform X2 [Amborella trichopoda]|eukprot:XP_020527979.1 uncharacterized protein LOC18442121 isoform X2 [Amborella trichopoda]
MEEKQLDFNAPLLSVRRFSGTSVTSEVGDNKRSEKLAVQNLTPPTYKSDLKSGPVRNPGTIPFVWEQIPGRPKDGGNDGSPKSLERPPLAPKLPPGRKFNAKKPPKDDEKPENKDIMNATRLQPIETSTGSYGSSLKTNIRSFSTSGYHGASSKTNMKSFGNSYKESTNSMALLERKFSNEGGSSDIEDDDVFADALDTLSQTESCFLNCSISGVSALDGQDLKTLDNGGLDLSTRKFMIDRFLPAARAMASESPQYAPSRKPQVGNEPVRQVTNISRDGSPLVTRVPNHYLIQKHIQEQQAGYEEEDDDDDDDDGDYSVDSSRKVCGLFPWRLKNSICLLNPVIHAPRAKTSKQMPLRDTSRPADYQIKTSSPVTLTQREQETWEAVYRHKLVNGSQTHEVVEDASKPTSDSASTPSVYGKQPNYSSDSQTPDDMSPYRHSMGGISPYRNEAPRSPFHEGMGFLGFPKTEKTFKVDKYSSSTTSHRGSDRRSGSLSPAAEKTVYIDSVHGLGASKPGSGHLESKEFIHFRNKGMENHLDSKESIHLRNKGMENLMDQRVTESQISDSSIEKKLEQMVVTTEAEAYPSNRLRPMEDTIFLAEESEVPACSYRTNSTGHSKKMDDGADALKVSKHGSNKEFRSSGRLKVQFEDKRDPHFLEDEPTRKSDASLFEPPLPPPLPKSPSESWLWRTLPSISSSHLSSLPSVSFQKKQRHAFKESPVDPKWERIVKSSAPQRNHLRFSSEVQLETT